MTATVAWPVFEAALVGRDLVADRTMAFRFAKPVDWSYRAGQFVDITLLDPPETDAEGNTRGFSISSAPNEAVIMITTRLRDTAFKRVLKTMPLTTAVKVEGPFGNLTLHNNPTRAAVLLAGGIGITPFRSMLFRAAKEKLAHRIFLFYSNRRPEDAAFLETLQEWEKENPNYKLVATMTGMENSHQPWHGETGLINQELLARYLRNVVSPIYYIAGPVGMVKSLHTMLNEAGVDDDDIRTEEFVGY